MIIESEDSSNEYKDKDGSESELESELESEVDKVEEPKPKKGTAARGNKWKITDSINVKWCVTNSLSDISLTLLPRQHEAIKKKVKATSQNSMTSLSNGWEKKLKCHTSGMPSVLHWHQNSMIPWFSMVVSLKMEKQMMLNGWHLHLVM